MPSPAAAAQQAAIDSAEAARAANEISRNAFVLQVSVASVTLLAGIAGTSMMSTWREEDKREKQEERLEDKREKLDQYLRDGKRYFRAQSNFDDVADVRLQRFQLQNSEHTIPPSSPVFTLAYKEALHQQLVKLETKNTKEDELFRKLLNDELVKHYATTTTV